MDEDPVKVPIDGTLDLHTFVPREVPSLVREYIGAAQEAGILELRIIHGKGRGVLRRTVHALLARDPRVLAYHLDPGPSGWGATLVRLHPPKGNFRKGSRT